MWRALAQIVAGRSQCRGQITTDNCHIDRVAKHVGTHDDALVEGRGQDARIIGRSRGAINEAIATVVRPPVAAVATPDADTGICMTTGTTGTAS